MEEERTDRRKNKTKENTEKARPRGPLRRAGLLSFLIGLGIVLAIARGTGGGLHPQKLRALEAFTIEDYQIEMEVRDDNSYLITERLRVNFTEARHGLRRMIPRKSYRGKNVEIRDFQANVPAEVSRDRHYVIYRLGDPEQTVKGPVSYELSYIYDLGEDGLKHQDELYFNLVGTDWDTTIRQFSFEIRMPEPFPEEDLHFTWGPSGSREEAPLSLEISGLTVRGKLQPRMRP